MLGGIIGDIVGSIYEFNNIRRKDFEFYGKQCEFTDDSILSFATAKYLMDRSQAPAHYYVDFAKRYPSPMGSYGNSFVRWVAQSTKDHIQPPYNSCGNGSAMRVGPVGWAYETEQETMEGAKESAECTHNHPEGIKGAQATAMAIFWARHGKSAKEIGEAIGQQFGYDLSMSVEELQRRYSWNGIDGTGNGGICQESVPQAIICALKATSFEDAVRNAISIGGDSDTIGCITGSIAEALYGIPEDVYAKGLSYLNDELRTLLEAFEAKYGSGRMS